MGMDIYTNVSFGFVIDKNELAESLRTYLRYEEGHATDELLEIILRREAGITDGMDYKDRKPLMESFPIEITSFGTYDDDDVILGVKLDKQRKGYWYEPLEISNEEIEMSAWHRVTLFNWCAEHGITFREPKWLVTALYSF